MVMLLIARTYRVFSGPARLLRAVEKGKSEDDRDDTPMDKAAKNNY
jgi:hypothetical protein